MSPAPSDRFTISSLLDRLRAEHAAGDAARATVDPDALEDLLGWFRSQSAAIVARAPFESVPLRLPKGRITDLLSCEKGTLARLGSSDLTAAMVRGRLTDVVVGQHLTSGLDGDVEGDVRDALEAAAEEAILSWLDEAGQQDRDRLWAHLDVVAVALSRSWAGVPREWWPRVEEGVSLSLADGALLLSARFDVTFGGEPTGLPLVIVEVKAGEAADRHRRDLLWYGLLAAMRHGVAPAVVATWTAADDGLVPLPVTLGALESAARRGLEALELLVDLAGGRAPRVTPHAGCRWCPVLDGCEQGLRHIGPADPEEGAVAAGGSLRDDGPEWEPYDELDDERWDDR